MDWTGLQRDLWKGQHCRVTHGQQVMPAWVSIGNQQSGPAIQSMMNRYIIMADIDALNSIVVVHQSLQEPQEVINEESRSCSGLVKTSLASAHLLDLWLLE